MAKKNSLKTALANHQAKSAERNRQLLAAANAKRVADHKSKGKKGQSKGLVKVPTKIGAPVSGAASSTDGRRGKGGLRWIVPFERDDHVLLVGEGNFSFSAALLSSTFRHLSLTITATSYDSEAECLRKYPNNDVQSHIETLQKAGVKVLFGVDARKLQQSKPIKEMTKAQGSKWNGWNKIIFNFPHVGAGIADQDRNILTNQHLLLDFLASAAPMLSRGAPPKYLSRQSKSKVNDSGDENDEDEESIDSYKEPDETPFDPQEGTFHKKHGDYERPAPNRQGSILVTLRDCSPYTLWDLPKLAKKPPTNPSRPNQVQPRYTQVRSFAFHPESYPGYEHRRTIGYVHGANEDILRPGAAGVATCRTWEFILRDDEDFNEQ